MDSSMISPQNVLRRHRDFAEGLGVTEFSAVSPGLVHACTIKQSYHVLA